MLEFGTVSRLSFANTLFEMGIAVVTPKGVVVTSKGVVFRPKCLKTTPFGVTTTPHFNSV